MNFVSLMWPEYWIGWFPFKISWVKQNAGVMGECSAGNAGGNIKFGQSRFFYNFFP